MGTNNKARRAEKKRRQSRARQARAPDGPDGEGAQRDDPPPRPRADDHRHSGAERARLLVSNATSALHHGDEQGYGQAVAALDALAGPRADEPHLGCHAVDQLLVEYVGRLWPNGWQPVEVERHVRRELRGEIARDAAAVVVDAMAAEHAHRRATTPKLIVDRRWTAQLDRLGAQCWWHDGSTGRLEQWAVKTGIPRIAALHVAIEVLHQLSKMRKIPIWMSYPGAPSEVLARFARSGAVPDTIDRKVLELVRALLTKAESTTFPDEADAFTAKAQQLMARHAIDAALVAAHGGGGGRDVPGGRRLPVDDPYANAKATLVHCVAQANRAHAIVNKEIGLVTIMGFEADLDIVELLVTSLLVQATAAMAATGRRVDRSGTSRTRSFRQSFLMAYAIRVGERLQEANAATVEEATAEYGDALLPVLVSREAAVREIVEEAYPEVRRIGSASTNIEGWVAGRLAADRANLGPDERRRLSGA